MAICFFVKGIDFQLAHPRKTSSWIKRVINKEKKSLSNLSYIFCSDRYLLQLNIQYLKHRALTDIITFDYSEDPTTINGEIYISIDRVKDNSAKFKRTFDEELHRVVIHGVLHLVGYRDKKASEKALMRKKEEACLSLR
jgi:probable rRNA maturation factor